LTQKRKEAILWASDAESRVGIDGSEMRRDGITKIWVCCICIVKTTRPGVMLIHCWNQRLSEANQRLCGGVLVLNRMKDIEGMNCGVKGGQE